MAAQSMIAEARISLRGSYAYSPSIRVSNGNQDLYDGTGAVARLGWIHGLDETFIYYQWTRQTANYTDINPFQSTDQMMGLGYRNYLSPGRMVFLEGSAQYAISNGFSNSFGIGLGGGINFSLADRVSLGITTLFTFFFPSGIQRRFITQSIDLGFIF